MTDMDATQNLDMPPAHRIGAVDYRLDIPAIALPGYIRMQSALLRPSAARGGRRGRWSSLVFIAVCAMVGILLGVAASAHEWTAELFIGTEDTDTGWFLGGRGVIVLAFVLMAITTLVGVIALQRAQFRILRNVHAAGGELFGAHTLWFGEHGIHLHNVARSAFVPWSSVTGIAKDIDGIFIVADHVSAFWITENVLAALPDRAGFFAYLERRMAEHPRADRTPA
jgi:hypothetical protein